jgi:hypothetical protein
MSEPNPIYYCNTDQQYFRPGDVVSKKPHELPFCPGCGERLLPVSARQLYDELEKCWWRLRQTEEQAERAEAELEDMRVAYKWLQQDHGMTVKEMARDFYRRSLLLIEMQRVADALASELEELEKELETERKRRKIGAVLTYSTPGHSRPCGQTSGANGAGQYAIIYYGSPEEADSKAGEHIRELERFGYKLDSVHLVLLGETFSGRSIREEVLKTGEDEG